MQKHKQHFIKFLSKTLGEGHRLLNREDNSIVLIDDIKSFLD